MAKKDKETIFNEFLADLKAVNPAVEEILKDEKVSAKLRDGVLARAAYSQSMDEFKATQDSFAEEVRQAREKIAGWQKWYGDATQQFNATEQELLKYKEEFGELSAEGQRREAAKLGMTPEEVNKVLRDELASREAAYLKFTDDLTDLKIEHRQKFNEKLDTSELYKIAGEKQVPLDVAYSVYIADRLEDIRKKDIEKLVAEAKVEGAREALSKHKLPMISSNPDISHVLDVQNPGKTSTDRVAAALASFNDRK